MTAGVIGQHAQRSHSVRSASKAYQWLACPPSLKLEEQFPDTSSEAAAEGTLAHELAEAKLRRYFYPDQYSPQKYAADVRKLKARELYKPEMDGHTDTYLDFVKAAAIAYPAPPSALLEERVNFGQYTLAPEGDPVEGWGTADCILLSGETLHVIDFKYGQSPNGRVSADHNPQLMLYALGALDMYGLLYPVSAVRLSIVQPRLPDGISDWMCTPAELFEFGKYVQEMAALAANGEGDFAPSEHTCRFCRARGRCRARAEKNIELAFAVGKKPPLISNDEMGEYLQKGEDVASWLSDLKDLALSECLAGREVAGWKAVEGWGSRSWTDLDDAFDHLKSAGIEEALLWERKPVTPPALEKALGKKIFAAAAADYVTKTPGKPTLVRESDKREAITSTPSAAKAFGIKGEKEIEK